MRIVGGRNGRARHTIARAGESNGNINIMARQAYRNAVRGRRTAKIVVA